MFKQITTIIENILYLTAMFVGILFLIFLLKELLEEDFPFQKKYSFTNIKEVSELCENYMGNK